MGETIEVRLSDQQHRQLMDEARQAGQKFFDYCRAKLTATTHENRVTRVTMPVEAIRDVNVLVPLQPLKAENERKLNRVRIPELQQVDPEPAAADRIARIEDAVARLTDYVLGSQQPTEPQPTQPIDVDSIVNAQFNEAEAAGLTEHVPSETEEVMRHAGVRALSRQPMKYSAGAGPRHLQGL